ncbi:glycosyltransferase [Haloarcula sp. CBA1130]|uniref:glycosyltransferase family 4 protein n=1 Tax=unclassified Haloarcula TaxID=2624677 RepID=UPI0012462D58|nr:MULTISPECIES: glycosyltransferase family 4 protein [unclassified Haloarcula]KAA9398354.1 glycosyltransferase [Haloarcula sp. CBA1129]KAA9402051.1 glycosyltransferase [Haloarcula sp. CBA1130]
MTRVLLLKLNGWRQTFDERVEAIAANTDGVVLVRPRPPQQSGGLSTLDNVRTYDIWPTRGRFVRPNWLKPLVFPVHVLGAILLMFVLYLRGELPPVVHALDYALGGMAGAVVSRVCGVSLVVSVRGLKDSKFERSDKLTARVSHRILQSMTEFVFSSADHIVTKSAYQVSFVENTCDVDATFTTVPTGVDFELFDPGVVRPSFPDEVGQQLDESDDIVLYLSTLIPKKGPDQVLRLLEAAAKELPDDVTFVFIGEFRDDAFEETFKGLGEAVSDRVVIHSEAVPFESVPGVLAQADATVLLSESKTEGVPRILQESCAMGTPIIAADVAGIADAFRDLPGCYLVDREDAMAFGDAVTRATSNPPAMPREVFAERFDMYGNYAKYTTIYDELSISRDR